jgi:ADP-ribosylglycohydrolase
MNNSSMIKGIIGSVIGDIAGSSHEAKPVKTLRFETLNKQSTITDDSVLTMAVAEWMLIETRLLSVTHC